MGARLAFGSALLAVLFALSSYPAWLRNILVPPSLPSSYSSLYFGPNRSVGASNISHRVVLGEATTSSGPDLRYCEDATEWEVDQMTTLVLLSCDTGRKGWNTVMGPLGDPAPLGQLWVIDPSEDFPVGRLVRLVGYPETSDFHPLGIDISQTEVLPTGEIAPPILLVVNHQRSLSTVEVFSLVSTPFPTATYLHTISHPSFTGAPNSVASISSTAFYLTHDHRFNRRGSLFLHILNPLETFLALPLSRVDLVTYDLESVAVETVARGISFANGAVLSRHGETLAVGSTTGWQLLLYSRDRATNKLTFRESVALPFTVDNLSLAPKGSAGEDDVFIAAGHPFFWPLAAIARGKVLSEHQTHPMSWVVAVSPRRSKTAVEDGAAVYPAWRRAALSQNWEVTTLFQSNGKKVEGGFGMSTTGVLGRTRDGRRWLVVPGLYEEGVQLITEIE